PKNAPGPGVLHRASSDPPGHGEQADARCGGEVPATNGRGRTGHKGREPGRRCGGTRPCLAARFGPVPVWAGHDSVLARPAPLAVLAGESGASGPRTPLVTLRHPRLAELGALPGLVATLLIPAPPGRIG